MMPIPAYEDYAPRIAAGQVWLLDDDGVLVIERHPDHAMIYSVALRPARHGRGLGRFLLERGGAPRVRLGAGGDPALHQRADDAELGHLRRAVIREAGRRPHPTRPGFTVVDMAKSLVQRRGRVAPAAGRDGPAARAGWLPVGPGAGLRQHRALHDRGSLRGRRRHRPAGLDGLPDELGDLLFQVVYHARMAEEAGRFGFADVARGITDKMIRRHPHVFADAAVAGLVGGAQAAERAAKRQGGALAGVPVGAARPDPRRQAHAPAPPASGSTGRTPQPCWTSWRRRRPSCRPNCPAPTRPGWPTSWATCCSCWPTWPASCGSTRKPACKRANAKFTRRFEAVEALLAADGLTPADAGLERMEAAWQVVKRAEPL